MLTKQKEVNENQTNNYYTLSTKCLPGCHYFDLAKLQKTWCGLLSVLMSSSSMRKPVKQKQIQNCMKEGDGFAVPVTDTKAKSRQKTVTELDCVKLCQMLFFNFLSPGSPLPQHEKCGEEGEMFKLIVTYLS